MMNSGFDREISFEILEHIGVLSTYSTGWNKELNIVRWNGGQPKYDIRDWDLDHEHMSRGVTLHEKEMRQMFDLMKKRRLGNRTRREEVQQSSQVQMVPPEMNDGFVHSDAVEESFEAPMPEGMIPDAAVGDSLRPEPEQAAF